ncbi:MAG: hypothetical protein ACPL06_00565 [Candidatus Anstonellales archaeon]
MDVFKKQAIRFLLIIPLAIVAALLIYSDNITHRAMLFVILVIIEMIRDVLTWSKKF